MVSYAPLAALAGLALVFTGCGDDHEPGAFDLTPMPAVTLESPAFSDGALIPDPYSCQGENISPPLTWSDAPSPTVAYVLLLTDPDAGNFVHWVVYDIPAGATGFAEGQSTADGLPAGTMQGENGFGKVGYGGPCPPRGSDHQYVFRIYALSEKLGLPAGESREDVEKAMTGKVLARGELSGRFSR